MAGLEIPIDCNLPIRIDGNLREQRPIYLGASHLAYHDEGSEAVMKTVAAGFPGGNPLGVCRFLTRHSGIPDPRLVANIMVAVEKPHLDVNKRSVARGDDMPRLENRANLVEPVVHAGRVEFLVRRWEVHDLVGPV